MVTRGQFNEYQATRRLRRGSRRRLRATVPVLERLRRIQIIRRRQRRAPRAFAAWRQRLGERRSARLVESRKGLPANFIRRFL